MRICLFLLLLVSCVSEVKSPVIRPIRAMQLEEKSVARLHLFPGRTRAVGRVNLSFRVSGPLVKRPVKVGDEVVKGQLLAQIDPRDFQVKVENAVGKVDQAMANLRFAESDYQRSMNIYREDPGAISESFLDRKKEDVGKLKGEVRFLEADLEAAYDELGYTYMRSPFKGIVVATFVENYEYVEAKQPIIRLLNQSQIEMLIDVPEGLIAQIPSVEELYVEIDAYPGKKFPAQVKEIGTEASITTRTYPVTLIIDQPDEETIFSGMAGRATLIDSKDKRFSEKGYLVPSSAILTDPSLDQSFVWIFEGDRVTKREVEVGQLSSDGILLTDGVSTGEWVVISGVNSLQEGEEVTLFDEDTP
ncbi:MAG: Multidrug resistance protein MdtA [Chlamydiales bacterium]|nr:Multidrug resistance protein MdtA [Chlamydiales bacterium]MCH9619882.1 Multidrug resistance protein MdtA [Chlamydiales bacterium]MCH9622691.1 Multidrug resistance protein MdtA [Chlamydiales bacterium]